jgi:putative pyoverdin transport system ATP-binding/permease protein
MKTVSFLLRHARGSVAVAVLAGVLSGAANAGLLALIAAALKRETPSSATALAWGFVALCAVVPLARVFAQLRLLQLTEAASFELRMQLGRRILAAPLRLLEGLGAHRLVAAFSNDIEAITQALAFLPVLAINLAIIAACMGYMGWLSWKLFLLTLAFLALGLFTHQLPLKLGQRKLRLAREEADALFAHVRSLTQGTKELKLHAPRRRAFLSRFADTNGLIRNLNVTARLIFSVVGTWGQLLFFVLIGLLLFVLSGPAGLTRDVLLGYTLVLLYMRTPLQVILDRLPELGRANIAVRKLEELGVSFEIHPAEAEADGETPADREWRSLELAGVVHSYAGDKPDHEFILGPIDLRFHRGELIFVVGGNGSGKTTLVKLLVGLYAPQAGEILLDGKPVTDAGRDRYRQLFSAVFSDFFLFDRLLGLKAVDLDEQAQDYLVQLQLDHKVRVEDGVLSSIDLSQGQRKRLALLTAFLEDRPIYVFDEWAADQDPHFKQFFYLTLLPELRAAGKTIFVISHDDRYYDAADRLIKLDYGQVVMDQSAGREWPTVAM